MSRRLFAIILALALVLALVPMSAMAETPMEISYVSWNCGEIEDDNMCEKALEEKFGVSIKTTRVDLSNATQVQLMLASGEMPECGWQMGTAVTLYDQGLTRTISEEMIRQYAPAYAALLDENPLGWRYNIEEASGEYKGLTGYQAGVNAYMLALRLDWLENLGIALPEDMTQLDADGRLMLTTTPYTYDELYEIMRAFTEDDPDGNGADDTYGTSAGQRDQFFWIAYQSAFGFSQKGTVNVDGVAENYYVTEKYKEFLAYWADVYAKGYLDREFATIDRQTSWEKYASGRVGVMGTMGAWVSTNPTFSTRPPMSIVTAESGKILLTPSPTNADRTATSPAYTDTPFSYNFVVRADVSDEKLAKILEIFDYVNFDDEAKKYFRWGTEGETYDFENPDGPNGIAYKEGVTNGGAYGLGVYNANYIKDKTIDDMTANTMTNLVKEYFMNDYAKIQMKNYRVDMFGVTGLTDLGTMYGATLNTLVDEYFYNVICGDKDLESSWDEYIATLNAAGYAEIHDELQKAPLLADLVG